MISGAHPWFEDGKLSPMKAAEWTFNLVAVAGGSASSAAYCAMMIAADLEKRIDPSREHHFLIPKDFGIMISK